MATCELPGWAEAVRWLQVSGLTKLLEGQKEASQGASSRKENRRETWCPGAQGEGDLPHAPLAAAGGIFCCSNTFTPLLHCRPPHCNASRTLLRVPQYISGPPVS